MLRRLGFLAAALATVGAVGVAQATQVYIDGRGAVVNPGAEVGSASTGGPVGTLDGWHTDPGSTITQVLYGAAIGQHAFPTRADAAAVNGGRAFFAGGGPSTTAGRSAAGYQQMYEKIALTRSQQALIKTGRASIELSAALGGFGNKHDFVHVVAYVYTAGSDSPILLYAISLPDQTPQVRGNRTTMRTVVARTNRLPRDVPSFVKVIVEFNHVDSVYSDAYVDNVGFKVLGPHLRLRGNHRPTRRRGGPHKVLLPRLDCPARNSPRHFVPGGATQLTVQGSLATPAGGRAPAGVKVVVAHTDNGRVYRDSVRTDRYGTFIDSFTFSDPPPGYRRSEGVTAYVDPTDPVYGPAPGHPGARADCNYEVDH